jgi:hypothetical protein
MFFLFFFTATTLLPPSLDPATRHVLKRQDVEATLLPSLSHKVGSTSGFSSQKEKDPPLSDFHFFLFFAVLVIELRSLSGGGWFFFEHESWNYLLSSM